VPLKIAYLLMRWLCGLVVPMLRGDRAKNAELLALRYENAVLVPCQNSRMGAELAFRAR
jgi:hypothetical protein